MYWTLFSTILFLINPAILAATPPPPPPPRYPPIGTDLGLTVCSSPQTNPDPTAWRSSKDCKTFPIKYTTSKQQSHSANVKGAPFPPVYYTGSCIPLYFDDDWTVYNRAIAADLTMPMTCTLFTRDDCEMDDPPVDVNTVFDVGYHAGDIYAAMQKGGVDMKRVFPFVRCLIPGQPLI